ncbi:ABC transporter permease [Ketogulonicigenium vulgare]|uniref:ABC transporter permease n=1 Tax=Ketogulonicigenium vulgare TaxID=92945 RepID=UPI0001E67B42|nr:ABC transporter permease [Ketogulonicigenium vulgare]ADO42114.1 ferric anguibactin transport system permease protein FATD [Ketogulonicigenium vulgare Y25]ALJ80518.1 iron ABC transporter permease [Ketogulonicigenium vulgare]ANW33343.1 iron ABC transporter permease [Ketogulonicigenium vulgare]AOZ54034.1 ferric anguibactin transporter permease FATD [Ketogulonicigenium vulgare]
MRFPLFLAIAGLIILAGISLFVGVTNVSIQTLITGGFDGRAMQVLMVSRVPRTLALILAGASMAISGLLMQMMIRNRFVEPGTVGTSESAALGLLLITIFFPASPVFVKMLVGAMAALMGTALFLRILRAVPLRDVLMVPLVGIMLSGVIAAITTFIAYRYNMMATVLGWGAGDFSGVLRGRYELLYIGFAFAILAFVAADRFTVAGMGRDFTVNLGLNYRRVVIFGLVIVSLISSTVLVSVGMIPFLGLVVPNLVSMMMGDNMRRAVPWVALLGAGFVLVCDIFGRIVRFPYEIPIGTVVGVVGSALFLYLLLRKNRRVS